MGEPLEKRCAEIIEGLYDIQYDIKEVERAFVECRIAGLKEALEIAFIHPINFEPAIEARIAELEKGK